MKLTHDLGLVTDGGAGVFLVHLLTDIIEVKEVSGLGSLQEREIGETMSVSITNYYDLKRERRATLNTARKRCYKTLKNISVLIRGLAGFRESA
jgi:hypothetical protein